VDFIPHTNEDRRQMLETIGVSNVEELLRAIPPSVRAKPLRLPEGITEPEVARWMATLARQNRTVDELVSFLGAGSYDHFIPAAVAPLIMRGEFITAYTPYQPEASQGSLQAIYEFQSLICELTDLDVANASLYDGASGLAEAVLLALRATERSTIVISSAVHPEYRRVLKTYLDDLPIRLVELLCPKGITDLAALRNAVDDRTAVVVVQNPNFYGCVEPMAQIESVAHAAGGFFVACVNPISLGALEAPGAYGADVAVGEAQVFGNPIWYGGPYVGFMAVKQELMRRIPGRLAGMTTDHEGRRGFVLTLQTREQHIRRQRATSNICTNEALCALAVTVYLSLVGKEGLREVAYQNVARSHYAQEALCRIPGVRLAYEQPFFNEFVLQLPSAAAPLVDRMVERGFLAGVPMSRFDPFDFPPEGVADRSGQHSERTSKDGAARERELLVCVTETKTREEIDRFAAALQEALAR